MISHLGGDVRYFFDLWGRVGFFLFSPRLRPSSAVYTTTRPLPLSFSAPYCVLRPHLPGVGSSRLLFFSPLYASFVHSGCLFFDYSAPDGRRQPRKNARSGRGERKRRRLYYLPLAKRTPVPGVGQKRKRSGRVWYRRKNARPGRGGLKRKSRPFPRRSSKADILPQDAKLQKIVGRLAPSVNILITFNAPTPTRPKGEAITD